MKEDTHEESALVLLFQSGNEEAYAQIFKDYYPRVCYYAMQIIGDQGDAEDIAVESFLKLLDRCKDFNTMYNIRGFLYQVTRRSCYNYRHAKKYRADILVKVKESMEQSTEDIYLDELEGIVIKKLKAAVETLPTECQRIFKMLFYQEMEPKEVALQLGITVPTVRSTKRYAIQLLRSRLSEQQLVAVWSLYIALQECGHHFPSQLPFL